MTAHAYEKTRMRRRALGEGILDAWCWSSSTSCAKGAWSRAEAQALWGGAESGFLQDG